MAIAKAWLRRYRLAIMALRILKVLTCWLVVAAFLMPIDHHALASPAHPAMAGDVQASHQPAHLLHADVVGDLHDGSAISKENTCAPDNQPCGKPDHKIDGSHCLTTNCGFVFIAPQPQSMPAIALLPSMAARPDAEFAGHLWLALPPYRPPRFFA